MAYKNCFAFKSKANLKREFATFDLVCLAMVCNRQSLALFTCSFLIGVGEMFFLLMQVIHNYL